MKIKPKLGAPKPKSRVGKVQARTTKALSVAGLHKGVRQHYIGGSKNHDMRNKAAAYLKSMRKG